MSSCFAYARARLTHNEGGNGRKRQNAKNEFRFYAFTYLRRACAIQVKDFGFTLLRSYAGPVQPKTREQGNESGKMRGKRNFCFTLLPLSKPTPPSKLSGNVPPTPASPVVILQDRKATQHRAVQNHVTTTVCQSPTPSGFLGSS